MLPVKLNLSVLLYNCVYTPKKLIIRRIVSCAKTSLVTVAILNVFFALRYKQYIRRFSKCFCKFGKLAKFYM